MLTKTNNFSFNIIIIIIIIVIIIIIITTTATTIITITSPGPRMLGWCPVGDSLISWGEWSSLALVDSPNDWCLDWNTGVEAP